MSTGAKPGKATSQRASAKYRGGHDACRSNAKGTKPLAEAASVSNILVMIVVHARCAQIEDVKGTYHTF